MSRTTKKLEITFKKHNINLKKNPNLLIFFLLTVFL